MHEANFVRGLCGQLPQLFHRFISSSHSVTPKSGAVRKNLEKIVFSIHGKLAGTKLYTQTIKTNANAPMSE